MKQIFTHDLNVTALVDCTVIKQTGNIIVSGQRSRKDLCTISMLSQQKGGGDLRQDKQQWETPCKHKVNLLGLQILWKEYLAISCLMCEDIKLMDLNSNLQETVVFKGRQVLRMCKGWHKIYVHVLRPNQILELDCSTTSFTLIKSIDIGAKKYPNDFCYMPSPVKLFAFCYSNPYKNGIDCTKFDSGETIWFNDGVDDRRITPSALLYLPYHRALLAADRKNRRVFLLDPGTGSHLQTIRLPDLGEILDTMLHNGRVFMLHEHESGNNKLSCFSVD